MKKLLLSVLMLSLVGYASASGIIIPQDLNGRVIPGLDLMGSEQAARTYNFEVGASTTGTVVYSGAAIFYGVCVSSIAAADQYIILRDTASVASNASQNLFGTVGFLIDASAADQSLRCVTFPAPIRLTHGLAWIGNDLAIAAKEVVTFFLLGI